MAKVRFIGDGETCEVFGHTFYRFKWTGKHTLAPDELERLAGNPTFEVDGGDAEAPDDGSEAELEPRSDSVTGHAALDQ